jgi:TRAP-type C4-dicarboxylate transport system substrate-binding protein
MARAAWTACLVTLALVIGTATASADELVLKFATLDNPEAHHNVRIHHPWAERLNQAAHGLFRVQVFDGASIANQINVYSRVVDDVAQIGWGLPDLVAGKFKLTQVVELPYLSNNSEIASTAFWRLYKTGLLDSEFDQVVPLKLIVFPQSGIQYREKPATLDNLNGLKVVVGSKITADIAKSLGGAPLAFPIDQYYEVLQRGTADAVQIGWTAFQPFKLADVTRYHLDVPLGSAPGYVFMARKKFDSLPEEVQKILLANSGEGESRAFGQFWDQVQQEARDSTAKLPGHTLLHLTPEQDKAWHDRVDTVTETWAKSLPNGEKVLATYRELYAQVKAGK